MSAADRLPEALSAPSAGVWQEEGGVCAREPALVDLLDRLLAGGVVLAGHLTLRIADVDLVRIDLRALITSVAPGEAP